MSRLIFKLVGIVRVGCTNKD